MSFQRFFPSQSTEPVTITDESSQDFFSQVCILYLIIIIICFIIIILLLSMSYKEIVQILPEVTHSKFYTAKNHAKLVGPGLLITVPATRQKMDPVKLDNFLDFITSEHIVRDLPFGERKIRLSDGTVMEIPNVVHSMGASDVIHQYKSFCAENEITPLGKTTLPNSIIVKQIFLLEMTHRLISCKRLFGHLSD